MSELKSLSWPAVQMFFAYKAHKIVWMPVMSRLLLGAFLGMTLLLSPMTGQWGGVVRAEEAPAPIDSDGGTVVGPSVMDSKKLQALAEYNKGVELFQIAQIQAEKGNLNGQRKLLREAIKYFESALKLDAKLVEAQSNIGFAYLTLRDNRRAIQSFERALGLNPHHLNTLNGLSTAYAFNKDVTRAIETFDKLTTLDPANVQYFFNKGSVLQKAGRLAEAEEAYAQALKIQPNDQRANFNMGTLLENQGQLEAAKPYYEKAKSAEVGNPVGLEAIRRLEMIETALRQQAP